MTNLSFLNVIEQDLADSFKIHINLIKKLLSVRNDIEIKQVKRELKLPTKITRSLLEEFQKNLLEIRPNVLKVVFYDSIGLQEENIEDKNEEERNFIKGQIQSYEKIPEDGMELNQLRRRTHLFRNFELFKKVITSGKDLIFQIKKEKEMENWKRERFSEGKRIFSISNEKAKEYIKKLKDRLVEIKPNKKLKKELKENQYLIKIINQLYEFLNTPRTIKEIEDLLNQELNYESLNYNIKFSFFPKENHFIPSTPTLTDRIRMILPLIANKSLNSDKYLRRDIIFLNGDQLGFYFTESGILFHIGKTINGNTKRGSLRCVKVYEILSHILKFGMSYDVFELFFKYLEGNSRKTTKKRSCLYRIWYLRDNKKITPLDKTYISKKITLVCSKFQNIAFNQIKSRKFFWFAQIENDTPLVNFINEQLLIKGISTSILMDRRIRIALLKLSRLYRKYTQNLKIKSENKRKTKLNEKFVCEHVEFGSGWCVFFNPDIDFDLVEIELDSFRQRLVSSVRMGMINGKPSFLKYVQYLRENGAKILGFEWTHGKRLSKEGGMKFPIEKALKDKIYMKSVEIDGWIISQENGYTILKLVQHKDGKYYQTDCIDLVKVINLKEISTLFEKYFDNLLDDEKNVLFFSQIDLIQAIWLTRNDLGYQKLKDIPNFYTIDYDKINYDYITENDFNPLDLSKLQFILNQKFKDKDINKRSVHKIIDKLDENNIVEWKMNGICAAVVVDSDGNVVCGIKNSKTKIILPNNYIKQFSKHKNSSFKVELMFDSFKTLNHYRAMAKDELLDLSVLKDKFFIVVTDLFCYNNEKYFLATATERRLKIEEVFLKNDSNNFKRYESNIMEYCKNCSRKQILMVVPGITFKRNESGLEKFYKFCDSYFFLVEFPFAKFYLNIDGMMIKTDKYDLITRVIYFKQAIKVKTFTSYTLLLWATKKSTNFKVNDKGLFVAMNEKTGEFFPVAFTHIKRGIARKTHWEILDDPIIYECEFPKPVFGRTINSVKKIAQRPNAKIDDISKILTHFLPSKNVIKEFYKISEPLF